MSTRSTTARRVVDVHHKVSAVPPPLLRAVSASIIKVTKWVEAIPLVKVKKVVVAIAAVVRSGNGVRRTDGLNSIRF